MNLMNVKHCIIFIACSLLVINVEISGSAGKANTGSFKEKTEMESSVSPETEVESVLDENTGRYVIRPINSYKRMHENIIAQEKAKKSGIAKEFFNIKRKEEQLSQTNPGFAEYLKSLKEKQQKEFEASQKDLAAREAAKKIIIEKWAKELDQDINLADKIILLKRWAKIALSNPWPFFENLEKVKKNFLIEVALGDLPESDENEFQQDLEELVSIITTFNKIKSPDSEETIATQWINAEGQEQKDQVIKNLIRAVEVDPKLALQAKQAIDYLKQFISEDVLQEIKAKLKKMNPEEIPHYVLE